MKKKRKRPLKIFITILVFALVLTIITIRRNHIETLITDTSAISLFQDWVLRFDRELTEEEVASIRVSMKDSAGNKIQSYVSTAYGLDTIVIQAPEGGYDEGETYTIKVDTEIPFVWEANNSTSKELSFTPKRAYENKKVKFQDSNLEKLIRDMIQKPTGDIYVEDVEGITTLIANGRSIKRIYGIEYLVNLRDLYLDVNEIEDIRPIKNLVYLQNLGLSNNKIKSVKALEGLKLKYLGISNNNITDYSPLKFMYDGLVWKDFEL
ncbi:leucine-rich repeat domain-containing protein [Clostridium thermarum]|uniref:leucine-rich repeat domain-containing protein n=1 Tax=Clostridium thermarum TaxID=1716543 RepID=UPI0013D81236|nr:leucine-rich repeat domain-containing protein [Clostridium thermarum]